MRPRAEFAVLVGLMTATGICPLQICGQQSAHFQRVASFKALGGLMASAAAEGPTPGSERIYASYLYADNTLDIVAINPDTGAAEVFKNPVPGEYGARNIAIGRDGDIYFGTLPHAHFLHLDRKAHRLIDLGRPSKDEEYIWDVAFGADGKLYGVTYPDCRLVRYDPATGKLDDLGRMDSSEKYGRWIVAGRDQYLYIGIGTAKANIAVYDTSSGEMREVLPMDAQIVGTAKPYLGVDGKVYATVGDRLFALSGFSVREIPTKNPVAAINLDVLKDGRVVNLAEDGTITVLNPMTKNEKKLMIAYQGENLQLFRIGFGPDDILYGSSILPIHFVKIDIAHHKVDEIGRLGDGEIYSFLAIDGRLAMGTYAGLAPLMSYDPSQPFQPAAHGNPAFVEFTGADEHWRPQAMIAGEDGLVYVGGTAGYGQLEGPVIAWDAPEGPVRTYSGLLHNQSFVSLAQWNSNIVGGTTTEGGGGSHPTEKDAHVILWDASRKKPVWDLIPFLGATSITDLITTRTGTIYGIAIGQKQQTLFAIDPRHAQIIATEALPFHNVAYNSVALAPDGSIWGLAEEGIFRIDDDKHQARLVAPSPVPITGGFALRGNRIYFVSGSDVYCYNGVNGDAH